MTWRHSVVLLVKWWYGDGSWCDPRMFTPTEALRSSTDPGCFRGTYERVGTSETGGGR